MGDDRAGGFVYEALPARVILGDGAVARVGEELQRLGAHRVMIVAGARHRALAGDVGAAIGRRLAGVFDDVRPHVPEDVGERARTFAAGRNADALVSIGGGSAIGLAKAVARQRRVVLVAVPTTYSGSEMTPVWGTTVEGAKQTGRDLRVLPDVVLYDPELTRSLDPGFAAASGLNAVAHSVEALYAPGRNPITELAATESLRRLGEALPRVVHGGGDPEVRRAALLGACLAGMALAQAGSSFHHKLCHVLGGRFGLPHAATHAAVLPHSVRAAAAAAPEALRPVARALGAGDPVIGIRALAERVGAPRSLAELGLPGGHLDEAADLAVSAVAGSGMALGRARLGELLRDAYEGRRPD